MRVKPVALLLCLLTVTAVGAPAAAFSPAPPRRHEVFSPNGAFVLDVDPERKVNTVFAAADRSTPLWSFPGRLWLSEALLSNDGEVVAVVQWPYVQVDDIPEADAVWFRNRGGVFRSYTVAELCPNPRRTSEVGVGPVGDFWRTWQTGVGTDGETVTVETTGGRTYRFRFRDGAVTGRRWNTSLLTPGRLAAGLAVVAAAGLASAGYVIRRRRRLPSWPRERLALFWGTVWFTGCFLAWGVATLFVAAGQARGSAGLLEAVTADPRTRLYLCGGLAFSFAVAVTAGVCAFIAVRRGPPQAVPSEGGATP